MASTFQRLADKIEASVSGPDALRYMADRLISESAGRSIFIQIEAARMAAELRKRAARQEQKDPHHER